MIKQHLQQLIQSALEQLSAQGQLNLETIPSVHLERARDKQHGDFASNVAMTLAKTLKQNPRAVAEQIIAALPTSTYIKEVTIAGPGFINFVLSESVLYSVIETIFEQKNHYGSCQLGEGRRVNIEYLSSNPTGPLHVGHGRTAAYGSSLSNLLKTVGYDVTQEYIVNDAGRQVDILAVSVWCRYLSLYDNTVPFPNSGYQGDYVKEIAEKLKNKIGDNFYFTKEQLLAELPPDESQGGDKNVYVDALITRAKELLTPDKYHVLHQFGKDDILADMKQDLAEFGVHYDIWFSEQGMVNDGAVERAISKLQQADYTYERDGALWFNAIHFGDDKDRVLIRANGQTTYFASDVAYHMDKFERGFDLVMDIFGADHHGYVSRVLASVKALGYDADKAKVLIVQFLALYRGAEKVPTSTRKGEFVTLRQLREEVGNDAARFFYIMRKSEQHMEFDLELAKSKSSENPVYYIQYAHARICSVLRQLAEKGLHWEQQEGLAALTLLQEPQEKALIESLSRYPEIIKSAALSYEPHQIAQYCRELAHSFHTYYNAHPFIVENGALRNARFCLIVATRQVLQNALVIIGVCAPEEM